MAASWMSLTRSILRAPAGASLCRLQGLGPVRVLSGEAPQEPQREPAPPAENRYREKPWEYLKSEEYLERYGSEAVWARYRRNHKGGIPPQKTRKTCIRGDKVCGNPCPVCRDQNLIVHHQNVELLEQFISPQTGELYDPSRTGVCQKQFKKLTQAMNAARDQGFLSFQVPFVDFSGMDYSNSHDAVGRTLPAPQASTGERWYDWYGEMTPDPEEVAKVQKLYKKYLKKR